MYTTQHIESGHSLRTVQIFGVGVVISTGATAAQATAAAWAAVGLILTPVNLGFAIKDFKDARDYGDETDQLFAGVNLALAAGSFFLVRFATVKVVPATFAPKYSPAVRRVGQGVSEWLGEDWRIVRNDRDGFVALIYSGTE